MAPGARAVALRGCVLAGLSASVGCSLLESFDGYTGGAAEDASTDGPPFLPKDGGTGQDSTGTRPDSSAAADSSTHADSSVPAGDAGTCPDLTAFTPFPWAPPTPLHQGACTSAQTAQYVATLNDPTTSSGSATCDACIQTDVSAAELGPIIILGTSGGEEVVVVNAGGCIAALDGSTQAGCCGDVLQEGSQCIIQECSDCSDFADPLAGGATDQCEGIIKTGVCKDYVASSSCTQELSVYSVCNGPLQPILDLWCGRPADAGRPADSGGPG